MTTDRCRIVLVDDVPELRLLLRYNLDAEAGMAVVGEAGNGQQAIDIAIETTPDVILLDLAMPVMDGLEALPHIRRHCPAAKVVVLSGFLADTMASEALRLGACAYIEKGAPPSDIVRTLRDLCGMGEAQQDEAEASAH